MSGGHKKKDGTLDPVYEKHGVKSISVLILLFISVIQIIGVIGLFIYNVVNLVILYDGVDDEVITPVWSIVFLLFSISGYFKFKISAYVLLLNNKHQDITYRNDSKLSSWILYYVKIPFNSILDIVATIMIIATISLWFL